MYLKIGDLKLLNIKVIKDGNTLYEGTTENAPDEIKEENYKSASFESEYVIIEL